jgi:hypothetical protein
VLLLVFSINHEVLNSDVLITSEKLLASSWKFLVSSEKFHILNLDAEPQSWKSELMRLDAGVAEAIAPTLCIPYFQFSQ